MRILNLELTEKFSISVHDFHENRWIVKVFKMPNDMTGKKKMWHYEPPRIKTVGLLKMVLQALQQDKDDPDVKRLIKLIRDLMQ